MKVDKSNVAAFFETVAATEKHGSVTMRVYGNDIFVQTARAAVESRLAGEPLEKGHHATVVVF